MDALPIELVEAIVGVATPEALAQIRVLNKAFCALATPHLFQRVHVTNTMKSTKSFELVSRSPKLIQHTEEVTFRHCDVDENGNFLHDQYRVHRGSIILLDSEEEESENSREATRRMDYIRDVLTMSLSRLHAFPALESLSLTFYPCFSKEVFHPSSYRLYRPTQLQWRLIPVISELPYLKSLTIRNLIPVERQALYGFESTFESLESLQITVLGGLGDTDYLYDRYYGMFWQFTMSSVLRSHALFSATLTSFTLHSGTDVGAHTPVNFSGLELLALKSVSLKRILFDQDTGVEDFIIRHQSTLKALHLVECRITVDIVTQEPSRRWSQIWTRFTEELQTLAALDVQPERDEEDTTLERSSYVRLIEGTGYLYDALKEPVLGEEDDRQALETFAKLVRSRQHGVMSA